MNRIFAILFTSMIFAGNMSRLALAADPMSAPLGRISDFSIPAAGGGSVSFSRDDPAVYTVLSFLGTECPLAKIYAVRLQALSDQFADQGVRFIGINSNIQDSMAEIETYVADHAIKFPVGKDRDCLVAFDAGATRTPEVIVVDRFGVVRYRGRIDDQYAPGISRSEATTHDLKVALEALVDGQAVVTRKTSAVGCLIGLPRKESKNASVTYCDQISRVLQANCIECHRNGEIGPFVLDDYDEVVGWADMSIEVIDQGRMPPWHATDDHAPIANARSMPESDKQLLREWVDAGMPYGDANDLPTAPEFVHGWQLPREPDMVIPMGSTPFAVPADGTVEYQYYVVDPGFKKDRWVRAAEVVPGSRSAVHHAIAFTRPPDGADFRDFRLLSAYVPGQRRNPLPNGFAQRVPAGSRIVFQMHYTPTGKPEHDVTKIGLVFADEDDVTHEVITLGGVEHEFEIPPGTSDYAVDGDMGWFPKNGLLLSIMPHMHLRGKSFEFTTVSQNLKSTVLEVPHYDFNWQHNYELKDPIPLRDVNQLSFTSVFDNSDGNLTNPDPGEYVTWGDQTWQEMAVTFISVAVPLNASKPATHADTLVSGHSDATRDAAKAKAKKFATAYLLKFDADEDGFIAEHELPHSVRIFSFHSFDHDGDERISRDEIEIEAFHRWNK